MIGKLSFRKLFYTLVFNTIIAVFLTVIKFGGSFIVNLIFSHCIGFSILICIHSAFYIFKPARLISQIIIIVISIIISTFSGTVIGSIANGIDPSPFINENSELFMHTVLFGLVFGSIISFIFISRENISAKNALIMEEKIKRLDLEKKAIEIELKLLQAQIEPHFLFNTLSIIISLIDTDPEKARTMMEHFACFLRTSFLIARDKTITISQEIGIIINYLNIHGVRMEDRLSYKINIPDSLLDYRIPPLLIQPLVENSIKHGLEPKIGGGEILIQGEIEENVVKITIADSGIGINESIIGNGIGLDNIRKRLRMFYNENGRLILEENKPSGVRAIIEIPYEAN